jgi:hypothetical protein
MKYGMVALLAAGLLAGCGGSDSTNSTPDAQSKQMQRSTKTTATAPITAASYENVVQSLYIAYFGRPADPIGLANFEASLAADNAPTDATALAEAYPTNAAVKTLIDSFGTSQESQNLYAGADSTAFVTAVFQHVLGRAPAQAGLDYWVGALNAKSVSQGNAALSIMGAALTNTSAQGLLDAQLIQNRITAAEYFTTQVKAQLDTSAYTGATAAGEARTMLSLVTASTVQSSFQAQENTTIAGLPNIPTVSGTTSPYTGAPLVQFTTGDTVVYDSAGAQYGIDASSYALVSAANNTYLNGLTVYPTNSSWYLMDGSNILGFVGYVTGPNGANVIGLYYTGNNEFGQVQINGSASAYSLGCTGACVSNTSTSATPVALQEIDTTVGTGATATFGKTVTVSYTGWLYDVNAANFEGTEFDSSSLHTGSFSFVLGAGSVISGWDIGVQGMKVGGTRTLIIPSILGYGAASNGSIPANAGLVFTVTVLGVQ